MKEQLWNTKKVLFLTQFSGIEILGKKLNNIIENVVRKEVSLFTFKSLSAYF